MTKQRHLSDGAVDSLRSDIASNRAGNHERYSDDYVERALDEIAWFREREAELEQGWSNAEEIIGRLEAKLVRITVESGVLAANRDPENGDMVSEAINACGRIIVMLSDEDRKAALERLWAVFFPPNSPCEMETKVNEA